MITQLVHHKLAVDKKDYSKFIKKLENHFPDWIFKDMEGVANLKDSIHFHISSSNKKDKGVVELTLAPALAGWVELKLETNRTK